MNGWNDAATSPKELHEFVMEIEGATDLLVDHISFGVDENQFVRYDSFKVA